MNFLSASQLLIWSRTDVFDRAERALRTLFEEILGAGQQSGEIRVDLRIEPMADVLTELTFSYANRQFVTRKAIPTKLGEGIIAVVLGGVSGTPVRPA